MRQRGQWQLAMYAIHLSAGHSICCKQIKTNTIEQYIFSAAVFLASFTGIDCRKDRATDSQLGHILAPIFRDLRKFETVPDRREPYDTSMHVRAREQCAAADPDSIIAALTDGFEQGLCAGYRLSEWAQPDKHKEVTRPQLNHLVEPNITTRALVPADIRAETRSQIRITGLDILAYPLLSLTRVWVTFRTQKNGQNGEQKLFTRNPNSTGICMVASLYRALDRFHRLRAKDRRLDPRRTPLSVFWDPHKNRAMLITSSHIESFMRYLACLVYQLDPTLDYADVQRWGTHSLRVGACVALHAMGFSPMDIQWLLRWRSMAFVSYLRNVAILSTRQHEALDRAMAMPHFI